MKKSSYKHVSDFGRLRSYGHFLIPVTPSCEPRLTEPAGGVMHSASLVADFSQLQAVQFSSRYLDTWEECGEGGVG